MVELYETGRWAFALNLVDHLPRTSAYSQAVSQDDELAEDVADHASARRQVALTEWSPEVEALAVVVDRLADVANTIIGVAGGHPSRVPRYPRPVTAFDRVRARRLREAAKDLESKLFPDLHP